MGEAGDDLSFFGLSRQVRVFKLIGFLLFLNFLLTSFIEKVAAYYC